MGGKEIQTILPWLFPSDIEYEYGYRLSVFEYLKKLNVERTVFILPAMYTFEDDFEWITLKHMSETVQYCKRFEIEPIFAFTVNRFAGFGRKDYFLTIPKNEETLLELLKVAYKTDDEDKTDMRNYRKYFVKYRDNVLIGEQAEMNSYSHLFTPFTKGIATARDDFMLRMKPIKKWIFAFLTFTVILTVCRTKA